MNATQKYCCASKYTPKHLLPWLHACPSTTSTCLLVMFGHHCSVRLTEAWFLKTTYHHVGFTPPHPWKLSRFLFLSCYWPPPCIPYPVTTCQLYNRHVSRLVTVLEVRKYVTFNAYFLPVWLLCLPHAFHWWAHVWLFFETMGDLLLGHVLALTPNCIKKLSRLGGCKAELRSTVRNITKGSTLTPTRQTLPSSH